ncbi:MAG TPA: hypothetical protein VHF27_09940 [Acidimicrobiales bacterium]|nr:hypothetical protein [Acidimicrobiales bacterium]
MRRYFAREPRLSREEIERQAQEAIDARVSMGRPPDEEFEPLRARLAEMDRAVAGPPLAEPQPLQIHQVQVPAPAQPKPRPTREPVAAARQSAN